jgi:hypothetical protein
LKQVQEPIIQPHKGRPKGARNKRKNPKNSTKSDPLAWEHQELQEQPKKRGKPEKAKETGPTVVKKEQIAKASLFPIKILFGGVCR